CAFVLFYEPLFRSMSLRLIQCAVIAFNVPSFCSMCRYFVQCAFVLFYAPLSRSMCLRSFLCAVISFNEPSFDSMCRISFNVPSFGSMDRYLAQCASIHVYEPFSYFYVPTNWSMDSYPVLWALIPRETPA